VAESSSFALLPGTSRKAIDRAGEELRRYWLDEEDDKPASAAVLDAFGILISFRETFQVPLNKTVLGLRSMVCSEQPELRKSGTLRPRIPVVQRLKRRAQIINKLARLEGTVVREGRRIEVQLRDPREHEWALAVERTGTRLGIPLKEGEGPADLREYFRLASLGMYRDNLGLDHDPAFVEQFAEAREQVRPYFVRR
jgi:hypothetical protein